MYVKHLKCFCCNTIYPRDKMKYKCKCGGSLVLVYDYSKIKKNISWKKLRMRPFDHWRYKEFYPTIGLRNIVSLGEGGTPLVPHPCKSNLLFKLESLNPTGAFKDRGSTLEISHALQERAKNVLCASTGNMGASVAAYAARAGLKCEIVLPGAATKEKYFQIKNFGASITQIAGDYTKAEKLAYEKYKHKKGYLVGDYAYRGEGEKSVAFEIMDQMIQTGSAPAYIFCPIGNGTLLSGMWRGLQELKRVGLIKKTPRLVGVQAQGCAPVIRAFFERRAITPVKPKTIASAIECGDPVDGEMAAAALRESDGFGVMVSDKEILTARRELAQIGIMAEPSGAVAYAGWKKTRPSGASVCVVTGHGLKDLTHV